jgi:RNA-binding protein
MAHMDLTGRQRSDLRKAGQGVRASCIVGRGGATPAVLEAVSRQLAGRELVKVKLPAGSAAERKALAAELARATGSSCVEVLGRTCLLYRPEE